MLVFSKELIVVYSEVKELIVAARKIQQEEMAKIKEKLEKDTLEMGKIVVSETLVTEEVQITEETPITEEPSITGEVQITEETPITEEIVME